MGMGRIIDSEILIDARPADVWAVLSDLDRYGEWNPFIVAARGKLSPGSRLRLTMKAGTKSFKFGPKLTVAEPDHELRWMGHLGIPGIFDGEHVHHLEATGEGTTYRQSEEFGGVLIPLMGGLLKDTAAGFRAMNAALKERVEGSAVRS
jgi:hypothetical protein